MNISIQTALIALLGGLIGGTVTAAASHFFGLEASRQELLQTARRNAYVDWLDVRQLPGQADRLRKKKLNVAKADEIDMEYNLKVRQVNGRIGVYGDQAVVQAIVKWSRSFESTIPCVGPMQRWKTDISIFQSMRSSLIPEKQAVSVPDTDLSVLIFGCYEPT